MMLQLGLIREGKIPSDNRVAFTPLQCKWIQEHFPDVHITVQHSNTRCFSDKDYLMRDINVGENLQHCDILFGIKEIPVEMIIPGKTYLLFSHTKKLQPHNRKLIQAFAHNKNTLIDYECLEHEDGTRVLGFGFFAGIVGAHNGMMAYGTRNELYHLDRVNSKKTFRDLIHTYFGLKLPPLKIAVTGNGRVAHGVLEIMNLLGIHETEPDLFLEKNFTYPVYVHLKPGDLYRSKETKLYNREAFHQNPESFECVFNQYLPHTDILLNGVYWEMGMPSLFDLKELSKPGFRMTTISDISDDLKGSVPCNLKDGTIDNPVYGVDKKDFQITEPYLAGSVDVMAVSNLPNELPKDASRYFGEQLIKYVLEEMITPTSDLIKRATILDKGKLTDHFLYMSEYVINTDSNLSTTN